MSDASTDGVKECRARAIEECARLCEEAADGKTRTQSDMVRNRTCLALAGLIRQLAKEESNGPV
jgi:hypothetical protein